MLALTFQKSPKYSADWQEYEVFLDGQRIGSVWKGWFRAGGTGWTWSGQCGYPSRRQAAVGLVHHLRRAG